MGLEVNNMGVNISLQKIEVLGRGVRAYRIIQQSLPEGTSLPEMKPPELTEKAQMLGSRLREQMFNARESTSAIPIAQKLL